MDGALPVRVDDHQGQLLRGDHVVAAPVFHGEAHPDPGGLHAPDGGLHLLARLFPAQDHLGAQVEAAALDVQPNGAEHGVRVLLQLHPGDDGRTLSLHLGDALEDRVGQERGFAQASAHPIRVETRRGIAAVALGDGPGPPQESAQLVRGGLERGDAVLAPLPDQAQGLVAGELLHPVEQLGHGHGRLVVGEGVGLPVGQVDGAAGEGQVDALPLSLVDEDRIQEEAQLLHRLGQGVQVPVDQDQLGAQEDIRAPAVEVVLLGLPGAAQGDDVVGQDEEVGQVLLLLDGVDPIPLQAQPPTQPAQLAAHALRIRAACVVELLAQQGVEEGVHPLHPRTAHLADLVDQAGEVRGDDGPAGLDVLLVRAGGERQELLHQGQALLQGHLGPAVEAGLGAGHRAHVRLHGEGVGPPLPALAPVLLHQLEGALEGGLEALGVRDPRPPAQDLPQRVLHRAAQGRLALARPQPARGGLGQVHIGEEGGVD